MWKTCFRPLLVPAMVLCSGCDIVDELTQEDITQTLTGSVVFQTFDNQPRSAEVDLNICQASQELCNRWENVKEIKVTAIVYTIRTLQIGPGVSRVAILPPSVFNYREGTEWLRLDDIVMADVGQRLGDPNVADLGVRGGEELGDL